MGRPGATESPDIAGTVGLPGGKRTTNAAQLDRSGPGQCGGRGGNGCGRYPWRYPKRNSETEIKAIAHCFSQIEAMISDHRDAPRAPRFLTVAAGPKSAPAGKMPPGHFSPEIGPVG